MGSETFCLKTEYGIKKFGQESGLNTLKETYMLTKIKKVLSKVTKVEWIILGVAVLALVVSLTHKHGPAHKGPHGGVKHVEKASVETVEVK
jgi:hypothetical protein